MWQNVIGFYVTSMPKTISYRYSIRLVHEWVGVTCTLRWEFTTSIFISHEWQVKYIYICRHTIFCLQLQGLEKHLMIASETTNEFNKDGRWPDIEVTKWPVLECISEPMQSDGYAKLSLHHHQSDMTNYCFFNNFLHLPTHRPFF